MMKHQYIKAMIIVVVGLLMLSCGVSVTPKTACDTDADCPEGQTCIENSCFAIPVPGIPDEPPHKNPDSGPGATEPNFDAGVSDLSELNDAGGSALGNDAGADQQVCEQQAYLGFYCDDGDACTINDQCNGAGNCVGEKIICDEPPDPYCADNKTLVSYAASGTCQNGVCIYAINNEICEAGCHAGACNPVMRIQLNLKTNSERAMASDGKTLRARITPTLRGHMNSTSWGLILQGHPK